MRFSLRSVPAPGQNRAIHFVTALVNNRPRFLANNRLSLLWGGFMGKRIDVNAVQVFTGSGYPAPFDAPCAARARQRLGDAAGLTDFGVNLLRLPAGAWSSQRHWHSAEDEFVYVLEGEAVLVTDSGEEILRAGDCAGFKAGLRDGHHLQNRSSRDVVVLEIGSRKVADDEGEYPDIDLRFLKGDTGYARKDGTPFK
jgi:uncharacterized cupin superfamily protein